MEYARKSFPVMNRVRLAAGLFSVLIVMVTLAACSADRWAEVASGEYTSVQGPQADTAEIATLQIDRERQTATFSLRDRSEVVVSFVARERTQWPSGCPANIGSTRMEVLDIEEERLAIGPITFDNPILVRNCPPDPMHVVLREDGVIGGSGTACSYQEKCLFFGKQK